MSEIERGETGTNRKASRAFSLCVVSTVLLVLWLPMVVGLFEPDRLVSVTEKRFLTERPDLSMTWESLSSFPTRMERYYDDNLGLRTPIIRAFALLQISLFGVSPNDKLIIGKDGWLFFGDSNSVAHYRGVAPLSPWQLKHWASVLEGRQQWLQDRGIAYLLVLVPDKNLIYGEYMPDSLPRVGDTHPLDQLSSYLQANTDVHVLDLRPDLEAAKVNGRIYHRTDSHWNDVGAYVAYSAILNRLAELVPALRQAKPVPVETRVREGPGMGLARIVGLAPLLREEILEATPSEPRARVKPEFRKGYDQLVMQQRSFAHGVEDRSLPRAVMFRDSFANALVPYLSEHFHRILYVWQRDLDSRVVLVEQPDVVIQQIVGRFLGRRPAGIEKFEKSGRR